MLAKELEIGMCLFSAERGGEGIITNKTARTVTAKFPVSTVKWTYKKDCTLLDLGVRLILRATEAPCNIIKNIKQ